MNLDFDVCGLNPH